MKEKLRKLDGKPTEAGYYWYREGNAVDILEVDGDHARVPGDDNWMRISELPGQWSERIPDCDWEGEA